MSARLSKVATAVLVHMRRHPEQDFMPLCTRDTRAADALVSAGMATVLTVPSSMGPLFPASRFYRLACSSEDYRC